jgi:hypothetical protein
VLPELVGEAGFDGVGLGHANPLACVDVEAEHLLEVAGGPAGELSGGSAGSSACTARSSWRSTTCTVRQSPSTAQA